VVVAHVCSDGALQSYISRRFFERQLLQAKDEAPGQRESGHDPSELYLKEWGTAIQCVAHVCHNAFKWSMWEIYPQVDHLEELWKVFAGIKNGSNLIQSCSNRFFGVQPQRLVPAEA